MTWLRGTKHSRVIRKSFQSLSLSLLPTSHALMSHCDRFTSNTERQKSRIYDLIIFAWLREFLFLPFTRENRINNEEGMLFRRVHSHRASLSPHLQPRELLYSCWMNSRKTNKQANLFRQIKLDRLRCWHRLKPLQCKAKKSAQQKRLKVNRALNLFQFEL